MIYHKTINSPWEISIVKGLSREGGMAEFFLLKSANNRGRGRSTQSQGTMYGVGTTHGILWYSPCSAWSFGSGSEDKNMLSLKELINLLCTMKRLTKVQRNNENSNHSLFMR